MFVFFVAAFHLVDFYRAFMYFPSSKLEKSSFYQNFDHRENFSPVAQQVIDEVRYATPSFSRVFFFLLGSLANGNGKNFDTVDYCSNVGNFYSRFFFTCFKYLR